MSVYFWKTCDFQILNQVSVNEECDPEKLSQFITAIIEKSFRVDGPLWEIISFPNYAHAEYGTNSAVALRFHHSLGDGLAAMTLVRQMCDPGAAGDEEIGKILKSVRKKKSIPLWIKLLSVFPLLFVTPVKSLYDLLRGYSSQKFP